MPANEYYDSTGIPSPNSALNTRIFNAEFNAIESGFDKLPPLSGHQNRLIRINSGGSLMKTVNPDDLAVDLDIELATNRNIENGHAGLLLQKLQLKNQLNTFISLLQNAATAERVWTLPDASGVLVDDTDTALYAPIANPEFTGSPISPTPTDLDSSSMQIINTEFARDALYGAYPGYFYMQDDILVQYGAALSSSSPSSTVLVNLPIPFDSYYYHTFGAVQAVVAAAAVFVYDASRIGIICGVASTYVFWMAIGQKAR